MQKGEKENEENEESRNSLSNATESRNFLKKKRRNRETRIKYE